MRFRSALVLLFAAAIVFTSTAGCEDVEGLPPGYADLCADAWRAGNKASHEAAVAIRKLFDGKALVSGIKSLLSYIHDDPALARLCRLRGFNGEHDARLVAVG